MVYCYVCSNCGPFDSEQPGDRHICPKCQASAKRNFQVSINRSSLKTQSRWDPVVGAYVENDRQFRTLLRQGQEAQSQKLNMDVKLETVDARDTSALAELHGYSESDRESDLQGTRKAEWAAAKA